MIPSADPAPAEVAREPAGGPRLVSALAYSAAWLPLLAVYATLGHAQGYAFDHAARGALWTVLPLALLGVPAARAIERLAGNPRPARVLLARHAAYALLYVGGALALWYGLHTLDRQLAGKAADFRPEWVLLGWQALIFDLVYAALAGVIHARALARRAERESMRAARAESLRARADLALLRSQLNPHFVLNVLHSLLGLVRRDPALAERALEDLGGLLGYGLRVGREERDRVPLRDEWAFVEAYLELEKMRLGERLDLRLDCDPEALDRWVPCFALQPLVENAVVHAIAPRARGGRLEVSARLDGERLRLAVRDDGPGLPDGPPDGDGLGLRLLRERLAVLYPGDPVLRLDPAPGGGLLATLDLPARRAAPGAAA